MYDPSKKRTPDWSVFAIEFICLIGCLGIAWSLYWFQIDVLGIAGKFSALSAICLFVVIARFLLGLIWRDLSQEPWREEG